MARLRLRIWELNEEMPPVCMVCGKPAVGVRAKTMTWSPQWLWLLILVNVLILIIVYFITRKSARLIAPLCEKHLNMWSRTLMAGWLGFLGVLALIGLSIAVSSSRAGLEMIWISVPIGFLAWLITLVVISKDNITPHLITKEELVLDKVHPDFIDAMIAADNQRRLAQDADYEPRRDRFGPSDNPDDDRIRAQDSRIR